MSTKKKNGDQDQPDAVDSPDETKTPPPDAVPEQDFEKASGLPAQEKGGVHEAHFIRPGDDLRDVNRKMDNRKETDRFVKEHTEETTPLGNTIRDTANIDQQIKKGLHGPLAGGDAGSGPVRTTR